MVFIHYTYAELRVNGVRFPNVDTSVPIVILLENH
jgi:hypothetical protein